MSEKTAISGSSPHGVEQDRQNGRSTPNTDQPELEQLIVPAASLAPELSSREMYEKLMLYHRSLDERDRGSYSEPTRPQFSVGLVDPHVRHYNTETGQGISIKNNHYRPSADLTGEKKFVLDPAVEANPENEIKIRVYQSPKGWGSGEKSFEVETSLASLSATIRQIESDVASGAIAGRYTHEYRRNPESGRMEKVPIE